MICNQNVLREVYGTQLNYSGAFFLPIQIWIDFASYLIKFYHMIFGPKMYLQKMALGNNNLQ